MKIQKRKHNKKWKIIAAVLFLSLIALIVFFNWRFLQDFVVGMMYQPSVEAAEIRTSLNLTDKGMLIFNASQPELNDRDDFNENCRMIESRTAILGCYADDKIFVYNIKDDELEGIREVTMAHELLHAVYARMGEDEREKWREPLTKISEKFEGLKKELEVYSEEQRMEELYVRIGTEIKELPNDLERHYAEIFRNQDSIAEYYNQYIGVFLKIEAKLDELSVKLENRLNDINMKSEEYERDLEDLNARIEDFNRCAEMVNCFGSEEDFYARRGVLIYEQELLKENYDNINNMVVEYNNLVEEYNQNVLHVRRLDGIINSTSLPDTLE